MAQVFYFDSDPALLTSQLGAANGVATLDGAGRLNYDQIPAGLTTGLVYAGTYDPATNLVNGTTLLASGGLLGGSQQVAGVFVIVRSQGSPTPTVDGISASLAPGSKLVSNGDIWEAVNDPEVITTEQLEDSAVTSIKIADNAIVTAKIAASNVTTAKIADNNVTAAKLATDSVQTLKIVDLNVTTAKLADNAVSTIKIGDSQVTTAKIGDSQVTTAKIGDSQVTTAKIGDDQVTTAKILNSAVTTDKINTSAVDDTKLANNAVTTLKILDSNVTAAKLATDAVTTIKIADSAVTTAKIADDAVTAGKIATDAVNSAEIVANAVTEGKIASDAVTTAKILNDNVTRAKLAIVTTAARVPAQYPGATLTLAVDGTGTETLVSSYDTSDGTTPIVKYRATKVSNAAVSRYRIYYQWRIPATHEAWTGNHIQVRYRTSVGHTSGTAPINTSLDDTGLAVVVYAGSSSASAIATTTPVFANRNLASTAWATYNVVFTTPGSIVRPTETFLSVQLDLTVAGVGNWVDVGDITLNYTERVGL